MQSSLSTAWSPRLARRSLGRGGFSADHRLTEGLSIIDVADIYSQTSPCIILLSAETLRETKHFYFLVQVAALGVFGYATFSIIAGCLGDYRKPPNLVVMVTGIISIVQVETLLSGTGATIPEHDAITKVGGDNTGCISGIIQGV